MRIARRAYAKVNLALSVGAALPAGDARAGMHPIASWVHSIELWDDVEVKALGAGPSRYERAWAPGAARQTPIDWPEEKDLGVRAHRLMEQETGRELPVLLRIAKRIPVGGGLGGGSSDAAAVMMAVNEVFGLGVAMARLVEISRGLGSDVAFFLYEESPARPAVVGGLGDRVARVKRERGSLVLVVPQFGCATGAVYRAFDGLEGKGLREAQVRWMAGEAVDGGALFNDLIAAAAVVEPRIVELMKRVEAAAGRRVHMSGSGSTLFVVAGDEGADIPAKIGAGVPDVTVLGVRLV